LCSDNIQKATGYVFPYTYSKGKIPFDYVWDDTKRKLIFGGQISRKVSDQQCTVLHGLIPSAHPSGRGLCFQVGHQRLFNDRPSGICPEQCPLCLNSPLIKHLKWRDVTLFMADKAIVCTKLQWWRCAECKLDVQNNGIEDGFWFHSTTTGISMQIIWDLLTLQAQGMESDFASYVAHCEQQTQARMGDQLSTFLGARQFREVYFSMLASCTIQFNQPCFGCWLSFEPESFPNNYKSEDIINCGKEPPRAARDISHVGMDGLANYMTRRPAFKSAEDISQSVPISSQQSKKRERKIQPLLQLDRCPIRTGQTVIDALGLAVRKAADATSIDREVASKTRQLFKDIGKQIRDISKSKLCDWSVKMSHVSLSIAELCGVIQNTQSCAYLLEMIPLLSLCEQSNAILVCFKEQKAKRFLHNAGDLFGQIGSVASILTLLKPTLAPDCFAFCRCYANEVLSGPVVSGDYADCYAADIEELFTTIKSKCSPGASEFPASFTVFILLDFFDTKWKQLGGTFQSRVNDSIVSTIRFIATRCTEVVHSYALRIGEYPEDDSDLDESCMQEYPVPVRVYGKDINKSWPDKLLGISTPPGATCNPVANNGFYSFTKHGRPIRSRSSANSTEKLFCGESECKKPSWTNQTFSSRTNFKQMLFTTFCVVHSIFMGYHIIEGGEGRKDPYNALFLFKESCPQSISYDYVCG